MKHYRDSGVIVRTFKLGESDRIISVVTAENGKVRAVAKGVRKTKSRFGGRLELLRHLDFQFYRGRGELDIVTQVETRDYWPQVTGDLDRLTKAMTVAEAIDQIAEHGEDDPKLYHMLCGVLKALNASNSPMLVPAFLLKLLAHEGLAPSLDSCVVGGEALQLEYFDPALGGVTCLDHRRGLKISGQALGLMRATLGGGLASVLEVKEGAATQEVATLVHRLWEFNVDRRLRSTELFS